MGTQHLFWLGLAAGGLALLFAVVQARRVLSFSEGSDAMKKIASAIREGANAYLRHQYATVFKVFKESPGPRCKRDILTHSHFLALTFSCIGTYKVCKTKGPLFPMMAD